MKTYTDLPEYKKGQEAYDAVVKAAEDYDIAKMNMVNKSNDILRSLEHQLVEAEQELAETELLWGYGDNAESSETKSVVTAQAKVEHIKNTINSFRNSGGIIIRELEKRLSALNAELINEEYRKSNFRNRLYGILPFSANHNSAIKEVKKLEEDSVRKQIELSDEIKKIEAQISCFSKNKKSVKADAQTVNAAKKVLVTAVESWKTRRKLIEVMTKKLEQKETELENIRLEVGMIYDCVSSLNPDLLGCILSHHEVDAALWPDIWLNRIDSSDNSFQRIALKIRREALSDEDLNGTEGIKSDA